MVLFICKIKQTFSTIIQSLIEVCINGTWSAVCDTNFGWIRNPVATSIVCKQLGFSRYGISNNSVRVCIKLICCIIGSRPLILYYRLIDFRVHLANFRCMGNEQRLIDCSYDYTRSCQFSIFHVVGAAAVECRTSKMLQPPLVKTAMESYRNMISKLLN